MHVDLELDSIRLASYGLAVRIPADAWRRLPPFDRLEDMIVARSEPVSDPGPCPDDIPIHVMVKGTRVTVRFTPPGKPGLEIQFRWRESHREWQLFAREGSRWVPDGGPRASVGRLLERLMVTTLLANSEIRRVPAGAVD